MREKFTWPLVAITCAVIVAFGAYFGLKGNQPQPAFQTHTGTLSSNHDISASQVSTKTNESDPIVYVTQTGQCYHSGTCSYLRKSKIPMKLSEAKMRYRPCSKCGPPQ